jgi:hypothetical protein
MISNDMFSILGRFYDVGISNYLLSSLNWEAWTEDFMNIGKSTSDSLSSKSMR